MNKINLKNIDTEKRNQNSKGLDLKTTVEVLKTINSEDKKIAIAIEKEINTIATIIDLIFEKSFKTNGRLFYVGAGSSGRIGVLDASEMLPTYGVGDKIFGLMAGGDKALRLPIEGAEDDKQLVIDDLKNYNFNKNDSVIAIGASGRTPYCISALEYAKSVGALPIGLSMTSNSEFRQYTDHIIEIVSGPEVVTGSTRMKSGTATKMVVNMISTTLMIKLGKVYDNLMVDLKATNEKLVSRTIGIVKEITNIKDEAKIKSTLEECNWDCKLAIVVLSKNITVEEAKKALESNDNVLRKVIN
ncbi:N-acetylmuramic acid 6-phosphate etherase [Spiroplasma sp. TIUS-1]|uniref:N-acetylmuramic acid 6-phosphate etherase n=1 Tax=Spiroplasma sp. TIUS-1 TaxID=216963 RepID=UPI0013984809|nr:N-acetylmuramic acid 6-phosphate etherase [Spiroplasma sp. TIUS-1]QHX35745.1 N-acetylmuramic acid 6-phosphate etherase [Spiroplasma sp. TIUS-1]